MKTTAEADLWVIMPVFNERDCVAQVIEEWSTCLDRVCGSYVLCVIDDGSTDGTADVLRELQRQFPSMHLIPKRNTGHGQTCVEGYRLAVREGARWVLQIDSDGQCDPKFFPRFWRERGRCDAAYGVRASRDDGLLRSLVTKALSVVTWAATRTWVRDGNVPYRLMRADTLEKVLGHIPAEIHLANVLVTVLQVRMTNVRWIPIHFRSRSRRRPAPKLSFFYRNGVRVFRELRAATRSMALRSRPGGR
jgi:dolichol-phosphate mannosyltransferase